MASTFLRGVRKGRRKLAQTCWKSIRPGLPIMNDNAGSTSPSSCPVREIMNNKFKILLFLLLFCDIGHKAFS